MILRGLKFSFVHILLISNNFHRKLPLRAHLFLIIFAEIKLVLEWYKKTNHAIKLHKHCLRTPARFTWKLYLNMYKNESESFSISLAQQYFQRIILKGSGDGRRGRWYRRRYNHNGIQSSPPFVWLLFCVFAVRGNYSIFFVYYFANIIIKYGGLFSICIRIDRARFVALSGEIKRNHFFTLALVSLALLHYYFFFQLNETYLNNKLENFNLFVHICCHCATPLTLLRVHHSKELFPTPYNYKCVFTPRCAVSIHLQFVVPPTNMTARKYTRF